MKLLAIDTSMQACSCALWLDGEVFESYESADRQHSRLLLTMLDDLLAKHKVTLKEIDAVTLTCGPGSFTGLRIGISTAQALGFAQQKPLIPVSTLAVVAQAAWRLHASEEVAVAVDARMQQVYYGCYQKNNQGVMCLLGEEQVIDPALVQLPPQGTWQLAGNGWQEYKNQFAKVSTELPMFADISPRAQDIFPLALDKYQRGEFCQAEQLQPNYLRDQVAKVKDRK